jgi:hypothetical protein
MPNGLIKSMLGILILAYAWQILSCTSLKSLADAKASPTFFASFKIKFPQAQLKIESPTYSKSV